MVTEPAGHSRPAAGSRSASRTVLAEVGAPVCGWLATLVLVEMSLWSGSHMVDTQLGTTAAPAPGGYLTATLVGLGLATAALVLARLAAGPRGGTRRGALVRAGTGAVGLAVVLGAMTLDQSSIGMTIADAALVGGETTAGQGLVALAALLLAVAGLLTIRAGRPQGAW